MEAAQISKVTECRSDCRSSGLDKDSTFPFVANYRSARCIHQWLYLLGAFSPRVQCSGLPRPILLRALLPHPLYVFMSWCSAEELLYPYFYGRLVRYYVYMQNKHMNS
jgi:hypothetical protein